MILFMLVLMKRYWDLIKAFLADDTIPLLWNDQYLESSYFEVATKGP